MAERQGVRPIERGDRMIDIAALVTVCQTAAAGGSKALGALRQRRISDDEKELLSSAAKSGEFHIISVGQPPYNWVRAGSSDFAGDNDTAVAAKYLEAFRSLCERGFIDHKDGTFFILTGSGFDKARSL